MLLSKRPDYFIPYKWPTYYSRAKGCNVWDLDGKKYDDFSAMGIGTSLLGYSNNKLNNQAKMPMSMMNNQAHMPVSDAYDQQSLSNE